MDYWICTHRNSSLKVKIYIHYFRRQGLLDSTLINVCRILKKTIQYMSYFEIVDIHAPHRKMIKMLKIATISKSATYWIVTSISVNFGRYANEVSGSAYVKCH